MSRKSGSDNSCCGCIVIMVLVILLSGGSVCGKRLVDAQEEANNTSSRDLRGKSETTGEQGTGGNR